MANLVFYNFEYIDHLLATTTDELYLCFTLFFTVPEIDAVQEMKSTISNLRLLLKECFRQLQEERKQSANLLSQVSELESKVLTYNQVITQLLKQQVHKTIYFIEIKVMDII